MSSIKRGFTKPFGPYPDPIPSRLKKTFPGFTFVKNRNVQYVRDNVDKLRQNVGLSLVYVLYLFTCTDTRLFLIVFIHRLD